MDDPALELYNMALRNLREAKFKRSYTALNLARSILTELYDAVDPTTSLNCTLHKLYPNWIPSLKDFDNLGRVIRQLTRIRDARRNAL